jgi:hypothetical protein
MVATQKVLFGDYSSTNKTQTTSSNKPVLRDDRGNMPEAVAGVVSVSVGNKPVDERAIKIWDGFC